MIDARLAVMVAGAVLAFALGVWIGLGQPGLKRRAEPRPWRSADRFRATWINRLFFRMDTRPRRFDAGRLIVPKSRSAEESGEREGEERETADVVRLRRPRGG